MNNIYGGMLDGQRLYEEDQRQKKQWEVEQAVRAINLDYRQQALPFQIEALGLANESTGLNNDFSRQINPYKVDYQQILNEGGRIGNDSARDAVDWARQDRPITRQALIFDTQAKGLNNYGKQINNAEAAASAPLNIYAKYLANKNNEMANSAKALEMDYELFRDPYRRGALNMDYNDAVMKHNTNVATYPDQRRAAEADAKVKARESEQSYDIQGVNNAFRQAYATNNYSQLGQSLSQLFDDDVLVQPQQDGKVLVTSEGKQQSFASLDALHKAISMASTQATKQEVWAVDPTNGYKINQVTGEMVKYATEPKPQELPMTNTTIGELAGQYAGSLGLNMSAPDKAMLQSDIQAGAVGMMRQGYSPSVAIQKAYEQIKPALVEGESGGWFSGKTHTYKGGALDMSKAPSAPATSTQAPSTGALDMSKAPTPAPVATPAPASSGALDMSKAPSAQAPSTGALDMSKAPAQSSNIAAAKAIIAAGGDRNEVIKRLKQAGIDTTGL